MALARRSPASDHSPPQSALQGVFNVRRKIALSHGDCKGKEERQLCLSPLPGKSLVLCRTLQGMALGHGCRAHWVAAGWVVAGAGELSPQI